VNIYLELEKKSQQTANLNRLTNITNPEKLHNIFINWLPDTPLQDLTDFG